MKKFYTSRPAEPRPQCTLRRLPLSASGSTGRNSIDPRLHFDLAGGLASWLLNSRILPLRPLR
jgi:hypothetical protein